MKKNPHRKRRKKNPLNELLQKPSLALLIVFLLIVITYANSLPNEFTYDDLPYIRDNKYVTSLKYLPQIFTKTYPPHAPSLGLYRPLVGLSYLIDYSLGIRHSELEAYGIKPEIDTLPFHITNILIHLIISALVYVILLRIFPWQRELAFFTSLIFAVHPVHVEVVASVVGRAESMSTLFYLLSLYLVIISPLDTPYYSSKKILSYLFFFFALLSKEMAITLPLILLIYIWVFRREELDRASHPNASILFSILFLLPYLAFFLLYIIIRVNVVGHIGIDKTMTYFVMNPGLNPLPSMLIVFLAYVKLMLFPDVLHIDYNFPLPIIDKLQLPAPGSVLEPWPLAGLFLLLLWLGGGIYLLLRQQKISLFLLWFPLTLFPVSNLIPFGDIMAERFLYLPSVGFCFLFAWLLVKIQNSEIRIRKLFALRSTALLIFLLIIAGMSIRSVRRNTDWRSSVQLWKAVERIDPNNQDVFYALGHAYHDLSMYHAERGNVYQQLQRLEEANHHLRLAEKFEQLCIYYYQKSLKERPDYLEACYNLSLVFMLAKNPNLEEAARLAKYILDNAFPDYWNDADVFNYNLGYIYSRMGKYEEAIVYFRRAIRFNPKKMKYYNDLGSALASLGKFDLAEKLWRYVLTKEPLNEVAENNIKKLEAHQRRYGKLPPPPEVKFKFSPPK